MAGSVVNCATSDLKVSSNSKKVSLAIAICTWISVVTALKVRLLFWAVKSGSGPEAGRK